MVYRIDFSRSPDDAAICGHETDGARAPDGDALTGTDVGKLGAVIACWENVGQQREIGLELIPGGQGQAVEVGMWHLEVFSLSAAPWPHGDVSVGSAGEAGVDGDAEAGEPTLAVLAEATADVERHHDPVARRQGLDRRADLFDYAHVLVAEDDARLGGGPTLVHVQVGATDAA